MPRRFVSLLLDGHVLDPVVLDLVVGSPVIEAHQARGRVLGRRAWAEGCLGEDGEADSSCHGAGAAASQGSGFKENVLGVRAPEKESGTGLATRLRGAVFASAWRPHAVGRADNE